MTEFIAIFSSVISLPLTGSMPIMWSPGFAAVSMNLETSVFVGKLIGRPSVHPWLRKYSLASCIVLKENVLEVEEDVTAVP